MRVPIREKLANIAREAVEATPRKGFTPKQRKGVWDAYDGKCAGCDEPLKPGWAVDHILPIELGGAHEPKNWQALCGQNVNGCHVAKTRDDIKRIAAARRIRKREHEGAKAPKLRSAGKIQSPGFRKDISKKFSGAVVPRKEPA